MKSFSRTKSKIIQRNTLENENLNTKKISDINVLLNRVRTNQKKKFQKKILFTAAILLAVILVGFLIF